MKIMFKLFLLLAIFHSFQSCDKPTCINENPILEKNTFDSNEYKNELLNVIQTENKINYWLNSYYENDQGRFIVVDLVGKNVCAKAEIKIINDKHIEDIIRTRGRGYIGAELEDLKFEINRSSSSTTFIYKSISGIID